jgi:acetyl-CoA synthetase
VSKVYPVPADWASRAFINAERYQDLYRRSIEEPEAFWREESARLDWIKPWTKLNECSFDEADFGIKWFEDGSLNASVNCLDRHLAERGDQIAIIWEGDDPAEYRTYTYNQLHEAVCRAGAGLRALGVQKGDRVTIYLPMIPEAASPCSPAADRGDPFGGVRRFLARGAGGSYPGLRQQGGHHRR